MKLYKGVVSIVLVKIKEVIMLYWASVFFIIALIAAIFGFSGIAVTSVEIAQILFYLFILGFILSIFLHFTKNVDEKTKFK